MVSITQPLAVSEYNRGEHVIPGVIQFEDFDRGGNGVAYYDDSPVSETGVEYRNDEDVYIELSTDENGGYNIGYATAGEWLEYTVKVKSAGKYKILLRIACNEDNRSIFLSSNGAQLAEILIPNTGGWQEWQNVSVDVNLDTGLQKLRFTIGPHDYVNLNYFTVLSNDPVANYSFTNESGVQSKNSSSNSTFIIEGVEKFVYEFFQSNGVVVESGWREFDREIGRGLGPCVNFLRNEKYFGNHEYSVVFNQ